MQERGIVKLEDVVVAKRGQSTGAIRDRFPPWSLRRRGAGAGVLGWLIAGPLGGAAVGTIGTIVGAMRDRGIEDSFIREVSDSLKPGEQAIFLLIEEADGPKVLEELKPFNALVVHTTLSAEQGES